MWNEYIWVQFWYKNNYCQCLNIVEIFVFQVKRGGHERSNFMVGRSSTLWDVLQRRLLTGYGKLKINKSKNREWSYFRVKSAAFCSLLGILSKGKKKQYEKQEWVLGRKNVDMLTVLQWTPQTEIKPFCCWLPPIAAAVTKREMIDHSLLLPRECILFGNSHFWELV